MVTHLLPIVQQLLLLQWYSTLPIILFPTKIINLSTINLHYWKTGGGGVLKSGKRKRTPTSTSSKALTFSTCEVQFKQQITKISRIGDTQHKDKCKISEIETRVLGKSQIHLGRHLNRWSVRRQSLQWFSSRFPTINQIWIWDFSGD